MFITDDTDDIVDDDTDTDDDDPNQGTDDDGEDDADATDDDADADPDGDDDDQDGDAEDADGEEDDDSDVTVTYEGVDYVVPKGLEKAVMQEADYTQKSQALATDRTTFNERVAGAEASLVSRQQQFDSAVAVAAIDKELKGYDDLDWQALLAADQQNDTNYVPQLQMEQQQLTKARETANEELAKNIREADAVNHDNMVKSATATRTALKQLYPEWTPALEEKMAQFAIGLGVPERQLRTTTNKATLDLLYKAYRFDQQEQKRLTAKKKGKKKDLKPAAPAAKVKGRQQGTRPTLAKLEKDPDAWRDLRNKQLAKKAAAGG